MVMFQVISAFHVRVCVFLKNQIFTKKGHSAILLGERGQPTHFLKGAI